MGTNTGGGLPQAHKINSRAFSTGGALSPAPRAALVFRAAPATHCPVWAEVWTSWAEEYCPGVRFVDAEPVYTPTVARAVTVELSLADILAGVES